MGALDPAIALLWRPSLPPLSQVYPNRGKIARPVLPPDGTCHEGGRDEGQDTEDAASPSGGAPNAMSR